MFQSRPWNNLLHLSGIVFFLIIDTCLAGSALKIRPKPCSNALGQEGTCMFVWECIKTEGKPLGTCIDGFLFGSCCGHNDSDNSINLNHENNGAGGDDDQISANTFVSSVTKWKPPITTTITAPTTTTTTTSTTPKPNTGTKRPFPVSYTTSQRPWIIFTGSRPHPGPPPAISTTSRPAIIWPIGGGGGGHHRPPIIFTARPPPWNISETNRPSATATNNITEMASTVISVTGDGNRNTTTTTTISSNHTISSSNKKYECGVSQLRPRTKVVGGKNSAFGAWPWQVSVRRISFFGFSSTHRCGGAILNDQWIATAGHCVDDLLLTQIRIRVGEYDFSSSMEPLPHIERGAKRKIVHPKYNFFTYENDLALVQLDKPIEFGPHISPICLPPDDIELLGRNATVTGWGRLSEGGVLPTVLQEVRVPIISNDKCKDMFLSAGRHEYIPDIFMCAGYDTGGRDSCQGDSGGPLQVQGDDGRWFLAGIISWGIGCGEPSLPGVCTRITKFKQWILSYISEPLQ